MSPNRKRSIARLFVWAFMAGAACTAASQFAWTRLG
jgi:hypothetical protein